MDPVTDPRQNEMDPQGWFLIMFYVEHPYNQRFGSISFWHGSGSGSRDPHLEKVNPDPRIHLSE